MGEAEGLLKDLVVKSHIVTFNLKVRDGLCDGCVTGGGREGKLGISHVRLCYNEYTSVRSAPE